MNERLSLPKGRIRLAAVLPAAGEIVCIDDVEQSLDVSRATASNLLQKPVGSPKIWTLRLLTRLTRITTF